MPEATSKLSILVQLRDEASNAIRRMGDHLQDTAGDLKFMGGQAGIATGALIGLGVAGFGFAIKQAIEAQESLVRMQIFLKSTGVSVEEVTKKAKEMAETSVFSNNQIANALAKNVSFFKNFNDAVTKTKLAMDIAALTGRDLESVLSIISKASQESMMALRLLGREVGVNIPLFDPKANMTEQFAIALDMIAKKVKGADQAIAEANQFKQISKNFLDLAEIIGLQVLPTINSLLKDHIAPFIEMIGKLIGQHPQLTTNIMLVVGALAAWKAAQFLLNPFLIIFTEVLGIIGTLLMAIPIPIFTIITILGILGTVIYFTRNIWIEAFKAIHEWVQITGDAIGNFFVNMVEKAVNAVRQLWTWLQRIASRAFGAVSGAVGGVIEALPFQQGGIVTRPTLGLLGEAGAEAVIPLRHLGGAGVGGNIININLSGDFFTTEEVAEKFGNAIARIIKNQIRIR